MKTRNEAIQYALSFPNTYKDTPFRDTNWQLVRVKDNQKAFLWTYEMEGFIRLNVKVEPEWRDYWRSAFSSVIPCHRVVNAKGELAGVFAFGGEQVQEKLLQAEGVEVKNGKVNLQKYGIG